MNNIEQTNKRVVYGNKRSESGNVQTKKKKYIVYTWLYWTSLLKVIILLNICQSFFYVQYLLLRKKMVLRIRVLYKWSLACDITRLLTIYWQILFRRRKKKNYLWNVYVLGASAIFFMHSVWREKLRISAASNIKNSASEL